MMVTGGTVFTSPVAHTERMHRARPSLRSRSVLGLAVVDSSRVRVRRQCICAKICEALHTSPFFVANTGCRDVTVVDEERRRPESWRWSCSLAGLLSPSGEQPLDCRGKQHEKLIRRDGSSSRADRDGRWALRAQHEMVGAYDWPSITVRSSWSRRATDGVSAEASARGPKRRSSSSSGA